MRFVEAAWLVWDAVASAIRPDPQYKISEWAAEHRLVPGDTSAKPGRWENDFAPYLTEIMDCLSPDHPCHKVTFLKSAQCGGSEIIMNALGYIVDVAPGPAMVVHPTINGGKSWTREKLDPNFDQNPRLKRKLTAVVSRDGGSTTDFRRFPGGFLTITGANSTRDLRQKSIRYLFKDDWDDWPLDVGGQGDPDKMADARQISFHESKAAKCLQVSTPTLKATSRSWNAYVNSDQRVFKVACPQCDHRQELRFFPLDMETGRGGLKFDLHPPHNAFYICEKGCPIEHHEKRKLVASGEWEAQNPQPGLDPGFRINALYSSMTTWEIMAAEFCEARKEVRKLKTFYNLWLGEPWEDRGDAPDHERLMMLREPYAMWTAPAGVLLITAGVDVQKDGLYYEVQGWGIGLSSWSIAAGFIEGDTTRDEVYHDLVAKVLRRPAQNAFGRMMNIDLMAIDTAYNTHKVQQIVRVTPRMLCVRGVEGPSAPIIGTPAKTDIRPDGKKRRGSFRIWPVGHWQAKAELYALLRLKGMREGELTDPQGYCHFSTQHDEGFFKQLTAESLVTRQRSGRMVTEWVRTGQHNHYLDCRVYGRAAAEYLQISTLTMRDWQALAAARNVPEDSLQGDLLSLQAHMASIPQPAAAPIAPAPAPQPTGSKPAGGSSPRSLPIRM